MITMFVEIKNMKRFYFFILLIILPFSSQAKINQPYGLFFVQENELKEGQDIFEVPTLKTLISVEVQGLLTTTTVKQYFINPTNTFTEAIYLFPLPDKSAVDQLRMKIGDRYINGIIQKKEQAEATYEKAKKQGKKTSLISSSRANIFKTKLANIAPGEMIVVEFRYQEKLMLREGEYSLRIPTVITHRYKTPQDNVIDVDGEPTVEYDPEIHSPINDKNGYTINPYTIAVDLNTGFNITMPKSIDPLIIDQISPSHFSIVLANGTMPSNKDFVLSFKPIITPNPYVQIYGEEVGNDLFLYGLINPQVNLNDLHLADKSAITIVADVSGSMSGSSLRQMKSILIDFINTLPEHQYINIIAFDDKYYKLFSSPKQATAYNKYTTLKFIKNLHDGGGTKMFAPIYEALFEKTSHLLDHQIILMTDGAISSERETMALVNQYIGNKRFHVVAIGSAPNSYLIKGLARAGRGSFLYVDDFTFKDKAKELLFKINHPVIKNLELQLSKQHEILPKKFSDVIANDPISFFLKIPNVKKEDLHQPIVLTGLQSSQPWKFEIHQEDIQMGKNINQLWAREKIDDMMFNNAIGLLDTGTYKKKATDLALQHSLVTEFTSLVAVDDQVSRENNQPLISHKIAQNRPDGWVDPDVAKMMKLMGLSNGGIDNLISIQSLQRVDLNTSPILRANFVQTATNKYFYFILAGILFTFSLTLFRFRRRLY